MGELWSLFFLVDIFEIGLVLSFSRIDDNIRFVPGGDLLGGGLLYHHDDYVVKYRRSSKNDHLGTCLFSFALLGILGTTEVKVRDQETLVALHIIIGIGFLCFKCSTWSFSQPDVAIVVVNESFSAYLFKRTITTRPITVSILRICVLA